MTDEEFIAAIPELKVGDKVVVMNERPKPINSNHCGPSWEAEFMDRVLSMVVYIYSIRPDTNTSRINSTPLPYHRMYLTLFADDAERKACTDKERTDFDTALMRFVWAPWWVTHYKLSIEASLYDVVREDEILQELKRRADAMFL